jgi:hypothetical protein
LLLMSLGHRRVLVVRGKGRPELMPPQQRREHLGDRHTPAGAEGPAQDGAPTELPITYAAEAVSWTGRLRRATPIARRPAVAAVTKDAAATVSVIAEIGNIPHADRN